MAINIADACRFIQVFTNAPNLKDSTFDFTTSNTSLSYAELATHPAPACIAQSSSAWFDFPVGRRRSLDYLHYLPKSAPKRQPGRFMNCPLSRKDRHRNSRATVSCLDSLD